MAINISDSVYVYMCLYIYLYIRTHTHTHTHTWDRMRKIQSNLSTYQMIISILNFYSYSIIQNSRTYSAILICVLNEKGRHGTPSKIAVLKFLDTSDKKSMFLNGKNVPPLICKYFLPTAPMFLLNIEKTLPF